MLTVAYSVGIDFKAWRKTQQKFILTQYVDFHKTWKRRWQATAWRLTSYTTSSPFLSFKSWRKKQKLIAKKTSDKISHNWCLNECNVQCSHKPDDYIVSINLSSVLNTLPDWRSGTRSTSRSTSGEVSCWLRCTPILQLNWNFRINRLRDWRVHGQLLR